VNERQIFDLSLHVMDLIGYATHARMLVASPTNIHFVEGHLRYELTLAGMDVSSSLSCNVTDLIFPGIKIIFTCTRTAVLQLGSACISVPFQQVKVRQGKSLSSILDNGAYLLLSVQPKALSTPASYRRVQRSRRQACWNTSWSSS
jgi:hypothetical protein